LYAILAHLSDSESDLSNVKVYPEEGIQALTLSTPEVILNYQSSQEQGSHWYAIVLRRPDKAYAFDSLGAPPDDTVMEWADRNNVTLVTSTAKAQSNSSSLCGLWAIWFIYMTRFVSPETLYRTVEHLDTYEEKMQLLAHSLRESV
jgi:hypothetical protein